MQTRSLILNIFLIFSAGSLSLGYISAGYWLILVVFPLMVLIWVYSHDRSVHWASSSLLLIHIMLTGIGIIANFSTILMVISGTTALVWWDLLQFNQSMTGNSAGEPGQTSEKYHLQTLAATGALGLMLALLSANFSLQFPFVITVILVLLTLGGLIFSVQYIVNAKD